MNKNSIYTIFSCLLFVACSSQEIKEVKPFESLSDQVDTYAAKTLEKGHINSLAISIYKDGQTYHNYYGEIDKNSQTKPNDSTLYEIASITKVFAGTLAARAVLDNKFSLEDDIRKYLGGDYPNLAFKNHPIRIKDLLTHTLGCKKRYPEEYEAIQKKISLGYYDNRPLDYGMKDLLRELKTVQLDKKPGSFYEYTSLGPELVAYILEQVYQKSYEEQLMSFLHELGIHNSYLLDNQHQKKQLANGYKNGKLAHLDKNPLLGGSAGLIMTLPDLTRFMKFQLESKDPVVKEASRLLFEDEEDNKVAYLWEDVNVGEEEGFYYIKTGTSNGVQSCLLICPDSNYGQILIMNNTSDEAMNDYGQLYANIENDLIRYPKMNVFTFVEGKESLSFDDKMLMLNDLVENKENYYVDFDQINNLGYGYLAENNNKDAIAVFRFLVKAFPEHFNAYDSLGEAYFMDKNYKQSLIHYKKSLSLNPAHKNAELFIEKLNKLL